VEPAAGSKRARNTTTAAISASERTLSKGAIIVPGFPRRTAARSWSGVRPRQNAAVRKLAGGGTATRGMRVPNPNRPGEASDSWQAVPLPSSVILANTEALPYVPHPCSTAVRVGARSAARHAASTSCGRSVAIMRAVRASEGAWHTSRAAWPRARSRRESASRAKR
jgi:hypothetical protein